MEKKKKRESSRIVIGDIVEVLRDIVRKEGPYVSEGTQGTVIDIFESATSSYLDSIPYYKVKIGDGSIKTLRTSSVKKI